MSVSLTPNSALGFNRPLTVLVKRTLSVTNNNGQPVAFKVKTTAPKLYCVRPNSGRIEPGESVDVAVMLQPMKEEPATAAKCKDKFLIQSTLITSEKETLPLHDIWNGEGGEEAKVHQQKLRVVYLPPEGQTVEEEDESAANQSSFLNGTESRYDTVRQSSTTNGHVDPIPDFNQEPEQTRDLAASQEEVEPANEFSAAPEDVPETHEEPPVDHNADVLITPPSPPPSAPAVPLPVPIAATAEPQVNAELEAKYNEAQAEIQRLRALLAAAPDPSSAPPTEATGLRRRNRALSDDGSTISGTDVGTMINDHAVSSEGVPLQVVLIIALGVFITTYLFF